MYRSLRFGLALVLSLGFAAQAHADRRYFVQSYTPYLSTAGSLDLEMISIAGYGQGDSAATAWQNRVEFEYGITDRLTGAAYLNFVQPAGSATSLRFDGPSLEFLYRFSEPGRLPMDPAVYLEVRENGDELEVEPKLLLARRIYQLVFVANVAGEFEHHFAGSENGVTEKNLRVTGGLTRELGHVVAIGIEAAYDRPGLGLGMRTSALFVGPTINLQSPRVQLTLGWHPQVSGHPADRGRLDLADFPRSEVRLILGVEL